MEQPLCMRGEAVCDDNAEIIQENVDQDKGAPNGSTVAVEKHDNGKHTAPDGEQSGTEEAGAVRSADDIFDHRQ